MSIITITFVFAFVISGIIVMRFNSNYKENKQDEEKEVFPYKPHNGPRTYD